MPVSMESMLKRDVAVKAVSRCGLFRFVCVSTRNVLREAMSRHGLLGTDRASSTSAVPSQLGSLISLTNLWAATLNSEERVRCEFFAQSGTLMSESMALGETRASVYLSDEAAAAPGALRVQRVIYGSRVPFESVTVSPAGSHTDLLLTHQTMHHSFHSDGVPCAVMFACAFDQRTGEPRYNGGVMVLPIAASLDATGDSARAIAALQESFAELTTDGAESTPHESAVAACIPELRAALDARFSSGLLCHDLLGLASGDWRSAADVMKRARHWRDTTGVVPLPCLHAGLAKVELNAETAERTPLDFVCRCSKADIKRTLAMQGVAECRARQDSPPSQPFKCHICNATYTFTNDDWRDTVALAGGYVAAL